MEDYRLIYHKVFPETDCINENERYSDEKEHLLPDYEEIVERIEARTIVPLEERFAEKDTFIKTAKEVAEKLRLDCQIIDANIYIRVFYYFDAQYNLTFLKNVIAYADDMGFLESGYGKQIGLVIDYYTHAIYSERTGKRLCP